MSVTEKISISLGRRELRDARRLASKLGLSLSTFITQAVREQVAEQKRREAAEPVLASFAPEDRASPDEMAALLARWQEPPPAPARSRRHRTPRPSSDRASPRPRSPRHGGG